MKLNYFFSIVFILILFSCNHEEDTIKGKKIEFRGGVVLTFDDDYVDDWNKANSILAQYNWKATFFVTHFDKLKPQEIQELKNLQNKGNEIAAHGLNHQHTVLFVKENGADSFIKQEINPMLTLMKNDGFNVTNFSYPYGNRTEETDKLLFQHFNFLRGTTYGSEAPNLQNCYYNKSKLIYGLGLDNSYPHFSVPYFLALLQYAKEQNKIVIFYAHKTVPKASKNYETEFSTLTEICKFVKNNNMKFYTVSDLDKIK